MQRGIAFSINYKPLAEVLDFYANARALLYTESAAAEHPWLFLSHEGNYATRDGLVKWNRPMAFDPDLVADAVRQSVESELELTDFG